ncbi:MAG: hypothetical protein ACTTK5_04515 [Candidatus Fimenecus sp.]
MTNSNSINIRFSDVDYDSLNILSKQLGMTRAEIIRTGLKLFMENVAPESFKEPNEYFLIKKRLGTDGDKMKK